MMGTIVNYKKNSSLKNMKPTIKIFETADQLASALADEFQKAVNEQAKLNKNFYVALSGGNTPALFFQNLVSAQHRENITWQNVHFFWGDERCVAPDHPDSNFGMTKKNLLDHIAIPPKNIHRILGEENPVTESKRYAQEIETIVPEDISGFPQFDWIFVGLGTEGHTASIFPGSDGLENQKNICAVATHPESGQKRITLTLPVINHAKRIAFLVTGENKASVVAKILTGAEESKSMPAALVRPVNGILEWYLDQAAVTIIRG
jgi:6-phosphogluconolactonase